MLRNQLTVLSLFLLALLFHVPLFSQTVPHIAQLSPVSGPAGTLVTISGSNFGGAQSSGTVSIGGISASIGNWSDTQITAAVPDGVTIGNASVTVTSGSGSTSNAAGFTVAQGTIFPGPVSYAYDELGRLVGVVAASGDAAQYTYDALGNVLAITRTTSSQPSLFTFSPKSGPVGTQVTIFGANFSSDPAQDTVSFNGTSATVTSALSTQLVVTVPAGATSGAITVTSPSASVTSASPFTVTSSSGKPRIDSFTPQMAAPGTAITIAGANFDPAPSNDRLIMNVTPAAVPNSAQPTSLTMTVPSKAGSGHISLNTPAGTTSSTDDLFIPPPGYTVSQLAYTGRAVSGSATTVSVPTANGIGLLLFDGAAGQAVSIVSSAPTFSGCQMQVYAPDASLAGSTASCSSPSFMRVSLATTGTYTLAILPSSGATGNVTVQLTTFNDVTGPIVIGTPLSVTTTVPGQVARYIFSGTAGQQLSMNLSGNTYVGCNAVVVSVLQSSGTSVGSTGVCNGTTGFMDSITLPTTGVYTVLVSPQGTTTGSITLLLNTFTDVTGTISVGTPLTSTTTTAGQNALYTFSGTAGQQLSMNLSGNTYVGCNAVVLNVLKSDGSSLASTGICNGSTGFMDSFTLPATGTYTVLVNPQGTTTGSVTLLLNTFADVTGTMSVGTPVTATTTTAGQNALFTFSGTAGQQLSMNLSGNTYTGCNAVVVSVLQSNGTSLASTGICNGTTGFMDSFTLPADGTYTVLVNPQGTTTGSVTMLLNTFGDISGTITVGVPLTVTTTGVGQNARYTFSGTLGQQLSMNLSGNTYVGCNAVVVSVLKSDGTSLASTGICNGATGFMDSFTLPAAGTYTVLVNPQGTTTGSVTLLLNTFTDISGTISVGTSLTATTTVAGQNARYTFSGTLGQQLSMNLSGNTYAGCNAVVVSVLKSDGSSLASTGICNGSTGFMDSFTLPAADTYTVLVNPQGTTTGSVTLLLNTFTDVAGTISVGTPVTATTTVAGQNARYTFSGTAGQQMSMNLSGNTYVGCNAVVISVLQPSGASVGSAGICNSTTGSLNSITLPTAGTYTILVDPQGTTTGSVTMLLNNFADVTGTISIGTPLTATTTVAGQNARYTFSGTSGQQLSMSLSGNTYVGCNAVVVSVLQPSGASVGSTGICNGSTGFMDSITLPVTGTYTVLVDPQGTTTGSVTLLLNPFADVTGTITIGTSLTATTTVAGQNARYTFSGTSGQQLSMNLTGNTYTGCNAVVVSILKSNGTSVGSAGACTSGTGFMDSITLPASDTYTVLVNPQGATTGSVTVLLNTFTDIAGGAVTAGTQFTATTTTAGQNALYTFSGTAGQQVSMNLTGNTYTGCNAVVVSLSQPSGATVGSAGACTGGTGFMDSTTLPVTGTYTLLVNPQGTTTGSVTVLINTFGDLSGTMTVGTPLTVTTTGVGQNARYTFSGTAGQQISMNLTGNTYTGCNAVVVSILQPSGATVGSAGACTSGTGFMDSITLPVTGTYTTLVNPQGATTGSVTILLNTFTDIAGGAVTAGTPFTTTTTTAGQNASYTFSGTAGQQMSMNLTGNSYVGCNAVVVSILQPSGATVGSAGACTNGTGFMDSITLPVAGTYTVLVNPQGTTTGSVTVLLNNFADVTGTIASGTPLTATTTVAGQNARYTFSGIAAQQVSASLTGNTYSGCNAVVVSILKPDGSTLSSTGLCTGGSGSIASVALPSTGTYTVLVNPQGTTTGSLTVALTLN
ncbi:MAG: IPT/TIG domain-containing protein [Acidobacteriia bacterium]|nr:IPT/TIG domain-containing protein [Terriglobia bacterium]